MSFRHYDVVAVVDPRDAFRRERPDPAKLNILRPITTEEFDAAFGDAASDIRGVVELADNGSVWCCWSASLKDAPEIQERAKRLADQTGGVIMDAMFRVLYPESAMRIQLEALRCKTDD